MPFGPPIPGAPWVPSQRFPAAFGRHGDVSQARFNPVGLIPRAPDDADRRKAAFSEKTSSLINSLIQQGYLQLTGSNPITWRILSGAVVAQRPPGYLDDASLGYAPGTLWVDAKAAQGYLCLDATLGYPIWLLLAGTVNPPVVRNTGYTGVT